MADVTDVLVEGSKEVVVSYIAFMKELLELLARWSREHNLKEGAGEVDFQGVQDGMKNGEKMSYCSVSSDVYNDMKKTGVLEMSGTRNYAVLKSKNDDSVMIFYGSGDQYHIDQALKAMEYMYGNPVEMDMESFLMTTKNDELFTIMGLSDADAMLLKHFATKMNVDEEGKLKNDSFPYTIVEMDGVNCVVCRESDHDKLAEAMKMVAATHETEQGEKILEQIQYKIKGRSERNIAIENARREQCIVDANDPASKIVVTAEDFRYYKNNKEIATIPLSDETKVQRVYSIIEGMSDPVLVNDNTFERLDEAEQTEYLHNKDNAQPLMKDDVFDLEVDMTQIRQALINEDRIKQRLNQYYGFSLKTEDMEIDEVVKAYEKEARNRAKSHSREENER